MAKSDASTVDEYLASLPEAARAALSKVRAAVRKNLPKGYEEGMGWVVGKAVAAMPPGSFVKQYEKARAGTRKTATKKR